jgi:hypothetical protein
MPGVGRHRNKGAGAQAQQIVFTHDPQNAFVIDLPPLPPKQGSNPAVAVVCDAESQLLNEIAQTRLGSTRG